MLMRKNNISGVSLLYASQNLALLFAWPEMTPYRGMPVKTREASLWTLVL